MGIKIKRRHTGAAGAPSALLSGQFAINDLDGILYLGLGDDGSGNATSIAKVGGAAFILASLIGAASGVAPLDSSSKVPLANLPASVVGGMNYAGTWNASTNSPALTSGTGTKGALYKVSVAGTTALDGNSQWNVGDSVVFDGTTWDKIDGIANEIVSVAGLTGAITATGLKTALAIAVSDVSGAAPLASPGLTGTPTAPTPAADTNTTQVATSAFVLGQASAATPAMDGTAAVGTATRFARADHVHPSDTTRAPLASPALTGTPTAPTATAGTSTTQLATTAFVAAAVGAAAGTDDGTF